MAPSSSAEVPRKTRCEWIRLSSQRSIRIHLALVGHLQLEQLLDREHEDELVVLVADVVDPLGEGDVLPVRLRLHRLLEAGVEVADHGRDAHYLLAVQVDDQAQDAVRRRVVRPEVDLQHVFAVAQLLGDGEHGRDPRGDARALVRSSATIGQRRGSWGRVRAHWSSRSGRARRRSGSPCAAGGPPSPRASAAARGSGGRRRRSPSGRTARARASRTSARPRRRSARARPRRPSTGAARAARPAAARAGGS